jgi:DNA-binding transcriptional regulator YhcF (GntR family)
MPSVLLQRQNALGLDALDLNIVLQIADHWWEPGNHPYPSKKSLAARIGVDSRTIQRRIARMERDGFIERISRHSSHGGSKTNVYRLTPLVEKAKPFARELIEERKGRAAEKDARRRRKRPQVRIIRSS